MSKVHILPNLRKGLSSKIDKERRDKDGVRAGFDLTAKVAGHEVGEHDLTLKDLGGAGQLSRPFYLAGPVDIQGISQGVVRQVVPADGSKSCSHGYMPYIEFFEEDFPWRYTPLPSSETLPPWLLLLACRDEEFTLSTDVHGNKRVEINLEGARLWDRMHFYPDTNQFHRLAHVQITTPGDEDPLEYIKDHPDDGVSRLFCSRLLETYVHYTVFLVPAFELGRLAGLGEDFSGDVGLDRLSWEGNPLSIVYPVYYQWSFTSGADTFMKLASKQEFLSGGEVSALSSGLKADISETGLKNYRDPSVTPLVNDAEPIDIPTALVKKGFSEKDLSTEDPRMDDELKQDLLLKSPVFSDDDASHPIDEDPWVVPPVYGARHILATPDDLEKDGLFIKDLNLKFRNRAIAGMGANVVKKNQEMFMNRAWGMVEDVNALNQRIRAFYQVWKTNGAAEAKNSPLRQYEFKPHVSGLQADAAIRVANAQSAAPINQLDLATDVTGRNLNVMYSSMGEYPRSAGITLEDLDMIGDKAFWKNRHNEIFKRSHLVLLATGGIDYYSEVDPKYRFLDQLVDVVHARAAGFDDDSRLAAPRVIGISANSLMAFRIRPSIVPSGVLGKTQMGISSSEKVLAWLADDDAITVDAGHRIIGLQSLVNHLESQKEKYLDAWGEDTCPEDGSVRDLLLPVVFEFATNTGTPKKYHCGYFMRKKAYSQRFGSYPDGIAFDCHGSNLYIFPERKLYDGSFDDCLFKKYVGSDQKNGVETNYIKLYLADDRKHFMPYADDMELDPEIKCRSVHIHKTFHVSHSSRFKVINQAYAACPSFPKGVQQMKAYSINSTECSYLQLNKERDISLYYSQGNLSLRAGRVKDTMVGIDWKKDMVWKEKDKVKVDMDKLVGYIERAYDLLWWYNEFAWSPNGVYCVEKDTRRLDAIPVLTADELAGIDHEQSFAKQAQDNYEMVLKKVDTLREDPALKDLAPEPEKVVEATKIPDKVLQGVDADLVNRDRLVADAKAFAERGMTLDLMVSNFDGKYPVMAAPVFPDPTSFYLRELSERYLLPSVDELRMNSISCFQTNPAFEEAFLAGMNTEMGRELLWREYPTDERGSCFRKFWDQDVLPADFSDGYFDVKEMHNWKGRLGENHEPGKGRLLVFVIKSELMCNYPDTGIRLSRLCRRDGTFILEPVLAPEMTGWLADDTYMAGFDPHKLNTTEPIYLTFIETDKSRRFKITYAGTAPDVTSAEFAVNRSVDGSVWGLQVHPDNLTL